MKSFPIVHVWSDIACPFCYIGKTRLLNALPKDAIVRWHSFILQPDQITRPDISLNAYLAQTKGWSEEQTTQIQMQVTAMAQADGLVMHMDRVVPANTTKAHLMLQMHAQAPFLNRLVERLFKAYFEEGINLDDEAALLALHTECGGTIEEWTTRDQPQWKLALQTDLDQAAQMGIRGVPYFYFENHFSINGAREPELFKQAVEQLLSDSIES